ERTQMAQIAGALNGNLAQQLRAMNGQVAEMKSGNEQAKTGPAARKVAIVNGQLAGGSGLSGAEFMNTLNVVRPNQLSGQSAMMQQDSQNTGDSNGFGQTKDMNGFRVIDG